MPYNTPEKKLAWNKAYRLAHLDKFRKRVRDRRRLAVYGATVEWFQEMLSAQEWCCAICGNTINESSQLDHNHVTGELRGILCIECNRGLGQFKDSPERLRLAQEYLSATS